MANSPCDSKVKSSECHGSTHLPATSTRERVENVKSRTDEDRVSHHVSGLLWYSRGADIGQVGVYSYDLLNGAFVHPREKVCHVFSQRDVCCGQRGCVDKDVAFVRVGELLGELVVQPLEQVGPELRLR